MFNLSLDRGHGILSDTDVVDDDMGHLHLLLEAAGGGQKQAGDLFECVLGLEQMVGGGGGYSNKLYVLVVEDPDPGNGCHGQGCMDGVPQWERGGD